VTAPSSVWPQTIRLGEAVRYTPANPLKRRLVADDAARAAIARLLDLEKLEALSADLELSGWFDGLTIEGRIQASIVQICGVGLEPFSTEITSRFTVRAVPAGSPHAPAADTEVVVDLDAEDPPDVLGSDVIDLGGYVVEHLALEIDPLPRKPGVEFTPPEEPKERSPFEVLRGFKDREPSE
jgi:uncharacterized metal-binding protein YceD (DUF177 family)